jgi:hypothetical protein
MSALDDLRTRRAAYITAEAKILASQEYTVGQGGNARRNRRAELADVQAAIKDLDDQIALHESAATASAARRVYRLTPSGHC